MRHFTFATLIAAATFTVLAISTPLPASAGAEPARKAKQTTTSRTSRSGDVFELNRQQGAAAGSALGYGGGIDHGKEYRACTRAAELSPDKALVAAQNWKKLGGGLGADHCQAIALASLGKYDEAAGIFTALGQASHSRISDNQKAKMLSEGAAAWQLAGNPASGIQLLDQAIRLSPNTAAYYSQRGVLYSIQQQYPLALKNFDTALQLNRKDVSSLTYRANAYRLSGNTNQALQDINTALQFAPNRSESLLERGAILATMGDLLGAQNDWQQAVATASDDDPAKLAAEENLKRLAAAQQEQIVQ